MIKIFLILFQFAFALDSKLKNEIVDFEPKTCAAAELIIPDIVGAPLQSIKGEYCFDSRYTTLVSKNCQSDCKIKKLAAEFKGELKYSQKGTPGAWLCLAIKGESLGAYFIHKKEKHILHVCKIGDEIITSDYLSSFRKK